MASKNTAAVSAFIAGAPPGELADVITDIKKLTVDEPKALESARPAFEKYNEEQLTVVKLPGSGKEALVSTYNSLGNGRYYDVESSSSFTFDHVTQKASGVQSYELQSQHTELITSLNKALSAHAQEHYPSSTHAVFPTSSDTTLTILLVANKYSPSNFWNGRWRSTYVYTPASATLTGTLLVDVHYYEDGNVRLTTRKPLSLSHSLSSSSPTPADIARAIATAEEKYQEELNRGFERLSEGEFKGLRRQLPITRQKVEWEKVWGYRLGQDIGGRGR